MFTVASRWEVLLEPASSDGATNATSAGRKISATDAPAARERARRQTVVDRSVSAVTAVRAGIARVAVYSTTANHDCEDSAEDAADVAAGTAAFTLAATSGRCDRLRTGTWERRRIDRSRRNFNRLWRDFVAHIRFLNFNRGRNALWRCCMLRYTLRRSNLARRRRRRALDCRNDLIRRRL